ncbi:MAG: hypothetical protein C0594_01275 [Marinilabiliales bacterium]|nr:MAG: hypothetical protein C0594_01275 [Marinilabiliales bacterium]
MTNELNKIRKNVEEKRKILESASQILKQEFFGIDDVIDELIKYVSYWYLFPDLLRRPVIINLWGMTGVGKTSLVQRLASLLDYSDKFYRFDLGEAMQNSWGLRNDLEEVANNSESPMILAMDEFQHARTLDEAGLEISKPNISIIWDLLDSGKFYITQYHSRIDDLNDLYNQLSILIRKGVVAKNGYVTRGKNLYRQRFDDCEDSNGNIPFIPEHLHDDIQEMTKEKFQFVFDVKNHLMTLNSHESVRFLKEVIMRGLAPSQVDCSKSLIFILGNLDEAYEMSRNFSADISADEFYEHTSKINISKIKKALQKRYRNEQIARFGNLHIIYPSLSEEAYRSIISIELDKVKDHIKDHLKVTINFDQSVHDIIYKEGVYPTLGTRPVFTTIHQIINSNLGQIFAGLIDYSSEVSIIDVNYSNNNLQVKVKSAAEEVGSFTIPIKMKLHELRKNTKDDLQAITAVHESGHAIASIILLDTIPEIIHSRTSDHGTNGFVYTKFKWKYLSKKEIIARGALFLAGIEAEKLVFGEENITVGSEDDIYKATSFFTSMVKHNGM